MYVNAGKVYVFQNGNSSVKVGCSKNVEQRRRVLETQSGELATKFYCTDDCSNYRKVETASHKILKEFRGVGEWFNCDFDTAVKAVDTAFREKAQFDFETKADVEARSKEFAEYWVKTFFPAFMEEDTDPKSKLDLEKWIPSKEDEPRILAYLMEGYEEVLDLCGEEEAQEYIDLYREIIEKGIVRCREKIQNEFINLFWAVDGEIEEYYADQKEWLDLMSLTILKSPAYV